MKNRLTFIKKILLFVWLIIFTIFAIVYFVVIEQYKSSILKEEESKIEILMNTAIPIFEVNYQFELYQEIEKELAVLLQKNSQIISIKILDKNNKVIIKQFNEQNNKKTFIKMLKPMYDSIGSSIGFMQIVYSNEHYLDSVAKFNMVFLGLFFIVIGLSGIFIFFLSKLFTPLEDLAQKLKKYNIKEHKKIEIEYQEVVDEVSLINNTILDMLTKIEEHTLTLENRVQEETQKNLKHELKLYEQAKMAQMGEMIGNIAHQWRQPLSVISSAASGVYLKSSLGTLTQESLFEHMNSITDNAQYLSKTIDTFRDFIKETKVKKRISLQDNLDETLQIVNASLVGVHVKLINEVDYNSPIPCNMVAGELSQVIINILHNARDVLVERKVENKWIKLNAFRKNGMVCITIEDNAGGIPKDVISKIFDPYFTTKHQSQGTGLGLHMSYKIIKETFHGSIYVENTQNGAKFFIEFPDGIESE